MGGIRDPKKDGEATNKRYVDNYVEKYVNDYVEKFKDKNGVFVSPWGVNMAGNLFCDNNGAVLLPRYIFNFCKNVITYKKMVTSEGSNSPQVHTNY